MEDREKGRNKREREEGSYFTRGRVTCLFRVVEQIYIALSPPVIPLCRCCCRTLDSVHQREIKGEKAGRGGGGEGKTRGKKKMEGRKTRNIVSWNIGARGAARRNVPRVMYALPALLFLRALVFAEDYPRCVAANRLFSVPRCVRTAAELNRLVHDRVNLRTVVSCD